MEKTNQRVLFTVENIMKCICTRCPVQSRSRCVKEKLANAQELMKQRGTAMMPKPEDVPGLYCASGVATCKDIDTKQMCICGDCSLWEAYRLVSTKPLGYYCRDGKAR